MPSLNKSRQCLLGTSCSNFRRESWRSGLRFGDWLCEGSPPKPTKSGLKSEQIWSLQIRTKLEIAKSDAIVGPSNCISSPIQLSTRKCLGTVQRCLRNSFDYHTGILGDARAALRVSDLLVFGSGRRWTSGCLRPSRQIGRSEKRRIGYLPRALKLIDAIKRAIHLNNANSASQWSARPSDWCP